MSKRKALKHGMALLGFSAALVIAGADPGNALIAKAEGTTTTGEISSNEDWNEELTLTGDVTVKSGATLTIAEGANVTAGAYSITIEEGATVNMTGGTVTGSANGTFLVGTSKVDVENYSSYASFNVSGGTITTSPFSAIKNYDDGKTNISGGTIQTNCSTNTTTIKNWGEMTVSESAQILSRDENGTGTTGSGGAVNILSNGLGAQGSPKFTMTGGTLDGNNTLWVFNAAGGGACDIDISGGTINTQSGCSIYMGHEGTLDITGGTITSEGEGVQILNGTVNITGGSITANGYTEFPSKEASDTDGEVSDGAAVSIVSRGTNKDGKSKFTRGDINLTIGSGVALTSNAGHKVLIYGHEQSQTAEEGGLYPWKVVNHPSAETQITVDIAQKIYDKTSCQVAYYDNDGVGVVPLENYVIGNGNATGYNLYGLVYDLNGGAVGDEDGYSAFFTTDSSKVSKTTPATKPTKNCMSFSNWGTNDIGTSTSVTATNTLTKLSAAWVDPSGDITADELWDGNVTLAGDVRVKSGATLTIATGAVVAAGNHSISIEEGATVNMTGGAVTGSANGTFLVGTSKENLDSYSSYASFNVSGGTITTSQFSAIKNYDDGKTNISGGTIQTNCSTNTTTIKNWGEMTVSESAQILSRDENGTGTTGSGGAVNILSNGLGAQGSPKFTMTGGTLDGNNTLWVFNAAGGGDCDIDISGGTINTQSGCSIYMGHEGTLDISGGTFTSNGEGVQILNGTVNMTGGTIAAKGATSFPSKAAEDTDGEVSDGAAVSIVSRGTNKNGGKFTRKDISLTIGPGVKLSSEAGHRVLVYGHQQSGEQVGDKYPWTVVNSPSAETNVTVSIAQKVYDENTCLVAYYDNGNSKVVPLEKYVSETKYDNANGYKFYGLVYDLDGGEVLDDAGYSAYFTTDSEKNVVKTPATAPTKKESAFSNWTGTVGTNANVTASQTLEKLTAKWTTLDKVGLGFVDFGTEKFVSEFKKDGVTYQISSDKAFDSDSIVTGGTSVVQDEKDVSVWYIRNGEGGAIVPFTLTRPAAPAAALFDVYGTNANNGIIRIKDLTIISDLESSDADGGTYSDLTADKGVITGLSSGEKYFRYKKNEGEGVLSGKALKVVVPSGSVTLSAVSISGTPKYNELLTAVAAGDDVDVDGANPTDVSFTWYRVDPNASEFAEVTQIGTGINCRLTKEDIGKLIRLKVVQGETDLETTLSTVVTKADGNSVKPKLTKDNIEKSYNKITVTYNATRDGAEKYEFTIDGGETWADGDEDTSGGEYDVWSITYNEGIKSSTCYNVAIREKEKTENDVVIIDHGAMSNVVEVVTDAKALTLSGVAIDGDDVEGGKTFVCGDTLKAIVSQKESDPEATIESDSGVKYQWYRVKVVDNEVTFDGEIEGAVSDTYVPTGADVGYNIKVVVTKSDTTKTYITKNSITKASELDAPTLKDENVVVTNSSITVQGFKNNGEKALIYEYAVIESNKNLAESDWQDSPSFIGLSSNTAYKVYVRTKGTAERKQGAASSPKQCTTKANPYPFAEGSITPVVIMEDYASNETAPEPGLNIELSAEASPRYQYMPVSSSTTSAWTNWVSGALKSVGKYYIRAVLGGTNYESYTTDVSTFEVTKKARGDVWGNSTLALAVDDSKLKATVSGLNPEELDKFDDSTLSNGMEYTVVESAKSIADAVWSSVKVEEADSSLSFTVNRKAGATDKVYLRIAEDSTSLASNAISGTIGDGIFTVAYNANGGVGTLPETAASTGSAVPIDTEKIGQLKRTGYTTSGWGESSNAVTATTGEVIVKKDLYAIWTPTNYALKYYGQDSDIEMDGMGGGDKAYGTGISIPAKDKDGNKLQGWSLSKNAATPDFLPGQLISNLGDYKDNDNTVKLYAVPVPETTYEIYGNVSSTEGSDVTLKLMRGSIRIGEAVTVPLSASYDATSGTILYSNGYRFSGIPAGDYNLAAEQIADNDTLAKSIMVTVDGDETQDIVMPKASDPSSCLNVIGGNTPPVVVDGLDGLGSSGDVPEGRNANYTMTVQSLNPEEPGNDATKEEKKDQEAVKELGQEFNSNGPGDVSYLKMDINRTVNKDGEKENEEGIVDTVDILETVFTLPTTKPITNMRVMNYHFNVLNELEKLKFQRIGSRPATKETRKNRTFYFNNATRQLYIYSKDYSIYGIGAVSNYTVSFDPGDGTGTMTDQSTETTGITLNPNTFTNGSKVFDGWKDASGNTYRDGATITGLVGDLTLTAQWKNPAGGGGGGGNSGTTKTHLVQFNMHGYGTQIADKTVFHNAKLAEPTAPIDSTGAKIFDGWYIDSEYTTKYNFNDPVTADGLVLHAKWKDRPLNAVYVTFDLNGQEGTAPERQELTSGGQARKPEDPVVSGQVFGGWYTEAACTNLYDFSTPVTADITLYAKWTKEVIPEFTVTFDLNGKPGTAPAAQTVKKGELAQKPEDPSAEGSTFIDWYKDAEGTETMRYDFSTPVTGDLLLYARWEEIPVETFTVTFDLNGKTGTAPAAQTVVKGEKATKPQAPTAYGYTFVGWFKQADGGVAYDFDAAVNESFTLYAHWDEVVVKTYTVTFDLNGKAVTAPAAQTVIEGNTATRPADPTAEGFVFIAWYADKDCTGIYNFAAPVTADITVYAGWKEKEPEPGPGPDPTPEPEKKEFKVWFTERALTDNMDGLFYDESSKVYEIAFTGQAIKPSVAAVDLTGSMLVEGEDYTLKYANNTKVSSGKKATVTLTGKGNYTGKQSLEFTIVAADLGLAQSKGLIAGVDRFAVESGKKLTPVIVYRAYKLKKNDFTLSNANAISADSAATLTGKGNFKGEIKDIPVKALAKDAFRSSSIKVKVKASSHPYNGEAQELASSELTVTNGNGMSLSQGDAGFVAYYANNVEAGKATVTIVGTGDNVGVVSKTFPVQPAKEANLAASISSSDAKILYTPLGARPAIVVSAKLAEGNVELTNGVDYKVAYSNNKKVGSAKYTVKFMGDYKGHSALTGTFNIDKADFGAAKVYAADMIYKKPGKYQSAPYVTVNGILLKKSDYTVKYYEGTSELGSKLALASGETKTIRVVVTSKGSNYTSATVEGGYQVVNPSQGAIDLSKAKVVALEKSAGRDVSVGKQGYTGEEITPEIRVLYKDGSGWKEAPASTYGVSYINNINKGSAVILVNGENGAAGSKAAKFTITKKNMSTFSK